MLTHLSLKNFAIVETLELELSHGMTVLTGETGAGKSIIIDALDLVLGGRANLNVIRHGEDKAEISAIFHIKKIPVAQSWLADNEFDLNDDEILLRRILTTEGRSRHTINGQACTQQQVRTLGELLLNIHGQHEHQNLVKRDKQRDMLDVYAHHENLVMQVKSTYNEWHKVKETLHQLKMNADQKDSKLEFLSYQVKELQELNLHESEFEALEAEHKTLAHSDQLREHLETAIFALEQDDNTCAINLIHHAKKSLDAIANIAPEMASSISLLDNTLIQLEEARDDLQASLDKMDNDPERLFKVEERLNLLYGVARKHRIEPELLLSTQQQLETELEQLEHADKHSAKLEAELKQLHEQYSKAANLLTQSRKKAAEKLNKEVTQSLQTLNMVGGKFEVTFLPNDNKEPSMFGDERVEFRISANPGQPLQALSEVASGGELSRMSLALQMITAQKDDTPTLIFDEVDVGIGGGTAEIVGSLLRALGEKTQVLCITHLPQVAAQAHHHFRVEKHTSNNQTTTSITLLNDKIRIEEIARMLGGVKITEQTLKHAKEMLDRRTT